MPEDSKKSHHKGKHDAKEQRKPRQPRQQTGDKSEKKIERKAEESKVTVTPAAKPVYEDPGPEFYKNLKRETDEILKIAEEANTKYKKKEIQSNWTKYEMPIESYDEMEEQENLGADYEKLISTPPSLGGHFQFKHEKSWDVDTGPSLYDKYFNINMENLATAICTVPFYERNNIDLAVFSQNDIESMNNRAIKYKRKYYNDKSYTTPELETQENLTNHLLKNDDIPEIVQSEHSDDTKTSNISSNQSMKVDSKNIDDNKTVETIETKKERIKIQTPEPIREVLKDEHDSMNKSRDIDDIDDILIGATAIATDDSQIKLDSEKIEYASASTPAVTSKEVERKNPVQENQKPIIASPEDLEKWLDDFLEG